MARFPPLALASIAVLALGFASARAGDEPVRLVLEAKDIPAPHVEWYGIYMNGTKSGYMRQEFGRTGEGAAATYFSDQKGRIQMVASGRRVAMDLSTREEFDATPPFGFRRARSSEAQGANAKLVEVTRTETGIAATVTSGKDKHTFSKPAPDYTLADSLSVERWFQSPRTVGDKIVVRDFDKDTLEMDVETTSVLSRKETVVAGVPTVWYEARQESEKDGDGGVARVDSTGMVISIAFGGMFEGRLETEAQAKQIGYGADLFVFGLAKIDKPIGDAVQVTRLVLEVTGGSAGKLASGPGQTVVRDERTGAVTLSLGAAFGESEPAAESAVNDALAETVDYPTKSPQVVELAAKAVGDAQTPKEKVARLIPFVRDYIRDEVRPEMVTVPEIIASKRGDCTEHALLFLTLARAVGVPTRYVSGLMYMGDDALSFGGHAWDEVLLDGRWLAVDATWGEIGVDATHVTLERKGTRKKDADLLAQFTFRLREVEPKR